jgi:hypothetical protein
VARIILSRKGVSHRDRRFNGHSEFGSEFSPVGNYPAGHWVERSGPLSLPLGVKVPAGGWHWEHRGTRLLGEGERYRFSVEVRARARGKLLGCSGTLAHVVTPDPPMVER